MNFLDKIEEYFDSESLPRILETLSITNQLFEGKTIELLLIDKVYLDNFAEIDNFGSFYKHKEESHFIINTELEISNTNFHAYKNPPNLFVPTIFFIITLSILHEEENDKIFNLIFPENGAFSELMNRSSRQ